MHAAPRGNATRELAAFASGLRFDSIPAEVIAKAKLCLLDTLGCIVYGSTLAPVRMVSEMVTAEGGRAVALLLGTPQRASPSQAALVNATAAHAFQLDEVHTGSTLHPGSAVIPATLALEAKRALSGRDFLTAMVAAYEVGIRIGLAADGGMFRRGYHNQGTTGALAAATAAACALGLTAAQTAQALGIAASQAAGLMAVQEGANAKALHCGRAAQSGVYAALLASRGYTGIEDVLDVEYGGFYSTFTAAHKPERLTDGLGERWETLKVGFKLSPASNGSITAMDTLARIAREHALAAADIERITAHVSTNTLEHCGWPFEPARGPSVLAAQMNLRYGLAVMALDRVATPAQYTTERIASKDVAAFLPRIDVRVHEAFDADPTLRLACRLTVKTRAGMTYAGETLYRRGGVEDPISVADLETKFRSLCSGVLPDALVSAAITQINNLETEPRVSSLAQSLESRP